MKTNKHIVCLGGGIGTVNLVSGLKQYASNLTTVVSLADDGGSAGRLRRLYDTYPLGDLISCMAAMSDKKDPFIKELLTYRFPGNRYAKDTHLEGHKVGTLILLALLQKKNDLNEAVAYFKKLFKVEGNFLAATKNVVALSALTIDGKRIEGEEKIDLGKYQGKKILERIYLHPHDAAANPLVLTAIKQADALVFGPGDLYTNLLPVMVVPEITEALKTTRAKKFFVINIANKPFETRKYKVTDFIGAVEKHTGGFPFDHVIVNNNFTLEIPKKYHYKYVKYKNTSLPSGVTMIEKNLVSKDFPLYHDSNKLAKVIIDQI